MSDCAVERSTCGGRKLNLSIERLKAFERQPYCPELLLDRRFPPRRGRRVTVVYGVEHVDIVKVPDNPALGARTNCGQQILSLVSGPGIEPLPVEDPPPDHRVL